jgi:hypothetical protein
MELEKIYVLKRFKAILIYKNENVEAMQGYIMKSLKSEFAEMHTLNKRRDNLPMILLENIFKCNFLTFNNFIKNDYFKIKIRD